MKYLHKTVDFVFLNACTQYLSDFEKKYQIRSKEKQKRQKKTSNHKKNSLYSWNQKHNKAPQGLTLNLDLVYLSIKLASHRGSLCLCLCMIACVCVLLLLGFELLLLFLYASMYICVLAFFYAAFDHVFIAIKAWRCWGLGLVHVDIIYTLHLIQIDFNAWDWSHITSSVICRGINQSN